MDMIKKYENALESFVEEIKQDNNVICVLYDSENLKKKLINDDSELAVSIIVKDDTYEQFYYTCIHEDIIFNVVVWGRLQMIQDLSHQTRFGGLMRYSGFAKHEVLFSKDDQFIKQFNEVRQMRAQTFSAYLMEEVSHVLSQMSNIKKHLTLKQDIIYCQHLFIMISERLAKIEHLLRHLPIPNDVVVAAKTLNPDLMDFFYAQPMKENWDIEKCNQAIQTLDAYFTEHIDALSKPILQLFRKYKKDIITGADLYLNFEIPGWAMFPLFKFLCDKEILTLVTVPVKLTKKSKVELEDIAFFYISD